MSRLSTRFGLLLVVCAAGCGPGEPAAEVVAEAPPARTADAERGDAERTLAAAVARAEVFLEFDEPAKAEAALESALAEVGGAADSTAALALLAEAKRRLAADARASAPQIVARSGPAGSLAAGDSPVPLGGGFAGTNGFAGLGKRPAPAAPDRDAAPAPNSEAGPEPIVRGDAGAGGGAVGATEVDADGVTIVRLDPAGDGDRDAATPSAEPGAAVPEPAERPAADARDVFAAVREAESLPTAAAALAALQRFAAGRDTAGDEDAARLLDEAVDEFAPRAAAGLVRSGRDWIAPAERLARRNAAAAAVDAGQAALEVGNLSAAREQFEEASDADPDGILGDLWLGTGYALAGPLWDGAKARAQALTGARDHFAEALRRRPDHVGALNNLALAEWKLGDVRSALKAWTTAAEVAPASRQLVQNVGRANRLVGIGLTSASRRDARQLGELYATLSNASAAAGGNAHDDETGWLVMPPVDPVAELAAEAPAEPRDPAPSREPGPDRGRNLPDLLPGEEEGGLGSGAVTVAFGSGFCVAPGYVLTNRHVVVPGGGELAEPAGARGGARRYDLLEVAADDGLPLIARLVALSPDRDLALLYSPGLDVPVVPLADAPPRLADDLLALGYPRPGVLGGGLKTTRGVVTGLPAGQADGMLLFDAAVNPGNSGGPVCTSDGAAAAVATKIFLIDQGLSAGVTAADARRFLAVALPRELRDALPAPPANPAGDGWADVAESVGPGVVRVLCGVLPDRLNSGFAAAPTPDGRPDPAAAGPRGWEDRSCPVCLGGGTVRCGRDGCRRGQISVTRPVRTGTKIDGRPIFSNITKRYACPTCDGAGAVRCSHCRVPGLDPNL